MKISALAHASDKRRFTRKLITLSLPKQTHLYLCSFILRKTNTHQECTSTFATTQGLRLKNVSESLGVSSLQFPENALTYRGLRRKFGMWFNKWLRLFVSGVLTFFSIPAVCTLSFFLSFFLSLHYFIVVVTKRSLLISLISSLSIQLHWLPQTDFPTALFTSLLSSISTSVQNDNNPCSLSRQRGL